MEVDITDFNPQIVAMTLARAREVARTRRIAGPYFDIPYCCDGLCPLKGLIDTHNYGAFHTFRFTPDGQFMKVML